MQGFGELNDISDPSKLKDLTGLEGLVQPASKNQENSDSDQLIERLAKEAVSKEKNNSLNLNEKDIDNIIKKKEENNELNSLPNKESPVKEKDSISGMESCDEIKKFGKQRVYCEEKYLLKFGEEKTVNCMKNFCSICCEKDEGCLDKCSTTHSFFNGHDPEEMFITVCSNENMGPAFKNFCSSMIVDNNPKEFDQCFTNFCFDCCSNELKINDFNDIEIQKCLNLCKNSKSANGKSVAQKKTNEQSKKPESNSKPIEISDDIKKILKQADSKDSQQQKDLENSNKEEEFKDLNNNIYQNNEKEKENENEKQSQKKKHKKNKVIKKKEHANKRESNKRKIKKKNPIDFDLIRKLGPKEKSIKICEKI